jgi:hypothetical protein
MLCVVVLLPVVEKAKVKFSVGRTRYSFHVTEIDVGMELMHESSIILSVDHAGNGNCQEGRQKKINDPSRDLELEYQGGITSCTELRTARVPKKISSTPTFHLHFGFSRRQHPQWWFVSHA